MWAEMAYSMAAAMGGSLLYTIVASIIEGEIPPGRPIIIIPILGVVLLLVGIYGLLHWF
jgi:hypothetical protein